MFIYSHIYDTRSMQGLTVEGCTDDEDEVEEKRDKKKYNSTAETGAGVSSSSSAVVGSPRER